MRREIICGVYALVHDPTGTMYVGASYDVENRFVNHFADLSRGKHHCKALQAIFDRDGIESFSCHLVEECDLENRFDREAYHQKAVQDRGLLINDSTNRSKGKLATVQIPKIKLILGI